MAYNLNQVTFQKPESINSNFFLVDEKQTNYHKILIVSFFGEYPHGSSGNKHGEYIATISMLGLQAFNPSCIILDFRELFYHWGDSILDVFGDIHQYKNDATDPNEPPFPILVISSSKSTGLLSLLIPDENNKPDWHFFDINQAITYGIKKAEEWLDS